MSRVFTRKEGSSEIKSAAPKVEILSSEYMANVQTWGRFKSSVAWKNESLRSGVSYKENFHDGNLLYIMLSYRPTSDSANQAQAAPVLFLQPRDEFYNEIHQRYRYLRGLADSDPPERLDKHQEMEAYTAKHYRQNGYRNE